MEGTTTIAHLNQWFAALLWEKEILDCAIYRFKGVAAIEGSNEKHIIQGVHENFDIDESGVKWKQDEKKVNKFVFIGKKLKLDILQASFVTYCMKKK